MPTPPDEPTPPDDSDRTAARFWKHLAEDIAALAAEYEDRGWQAFDFQVGSVTPVADDEVNERNGFSVLIPDNQFENLTQNQQFIEEFDSYELYQTTQPDQIYNVAAIEHSKERIAFLIPMYYEPTDQSVRDMFEIADRDGVIHVTLRTLSSDRITLTFDEPEVFKPHSA